MFSRIPLTLGGWGASGCMGQTWSKEGKPLVCLRVKGKPGSRGGSWAPTLQPRDVPATGTPWKLLPTRTVCHPLPAQPPEARPPVSHGTSGCLAGGSDPDPGKRGPSSSFAKSRNCSGAIYTKNKGGTGVRAGLGKGGHRHVWKCLPPSWGWYSLLTDEVWGQRAREREESGVLSQIPKAKSRAVPKVQRITPHWKPVASFQVPQKASYGTVRKKP